MTQLTAASDLYDRGSSEYHELSESLKTLVESAYYLRTAWEMLDTLTYTSRREGRHDDSHDLRSPEQSAYLAWQAAELAFQQIISRWVAKKDAATGAITISEPAPVPDVPDEAIVFSWDAKSEHDRAALLSDI